ncbi:hypothetical protein JX266_006707 [Neoarthrinium moseri]|nr:hypothetical protein JX266_006707 [Neoarthrinium moseri]
MDYSLEHHQSYIGKPVSDLPTPSLIISLPAVKKNVETLHKDVEGLGIRFRPHVKTLKALEVTRMMLGEGKHRAVVASTLAEIRGVLPLAKEGLLDECLYGLPVVSSYLPQLAELRKSLRILLMVDNEQQVSLLERFGADQPWDIFIKIDVGTHRAGVLAGSSALHSLVKRAEASNHAQIYGFYCHAGHSYASRTSEQAQQTLSEEFSSVIGASGLLPADRELVVSIGSTPTAHVVSSLKAQLPGNTKLELHAGNFPANDLQQVSTSLVQIQDQAVRIAAEVCSVYPERNEALINAGAIALSKEVSPNYPGFGTVVGKLDWGVIRVSQEHGILASSKTGALADKEFHVGQRIYLYCNHACITAAAFYVYYVVDANDIVVATWIPWKGW